MTRKHRQPSRGSLQEYTLAENTDLRLDRENGILRSVKILGLVSKNQRRYAPEALQAAIPLYEGAKVNVNHPKGDPLSPRDYQDRLGSIRNVVYRPNEGLFADLYFNPCHPLANQLAWDAEHAPKNVGFSHNIRAQTTEENHTVVVKQILSVQSVDLVADPATTSGLYEAEDAEQNAATVPSVSENSEPVSVTSEACTADVSELTADSSAEADSELSTEATSELPAEANAETTPEATVETDGDPAFAVPTMENITVATEESAGSAQTASESGETVPASAEPTQEPVEITPATEATFPEAISSAVLQVVTKLVESLQHKLEALHECQNTLQTKLLEFLRRSVPSQTPQSQEQELPFKEDKLTTSEFVKKIRR